MKKLSLYLFNFAYVFYKSFFPSRGVCRFQPTCSVYCYQAIDRYGIIVGSWKCLKRVVRCHPWSRGGNDPLKLSN